MCREIHVSDIRMALLDYCEEDFRAERSHVEDLVAEMEEPLVHAVDHGQRAAGLAAAGDDGAADIHRALLTNMARAAAFV
jgi:hypothetical protein